MLKLKNHCKQILVTPVYSVSTSQNGRMLLKDIKNQNMKVYVITDECAHKAQTKGHLKTHKESKHEGVCYSCDECGYRAMHKGHLRIHVESQHSYFYLTTIY